MARGRAQRDSYIDLYWLPLGAGGHSVRWNGRIYEAILAWRQHRKPADLYHAALEITDNGERFVVEMAPVWNEPSPDRGVVCVGPVGSHLLEHSRMFQYEVRCWPNGQIPDIAEAVDSPQRVSHDPAQVSAVLAVIGDVPAYVWGRDELHCGDMWNSNSLVAWLLARSGHDMTAINPPEDGRAPGWEAGLALAALDSSFRAEGPTK